MFLILTLFCLSELNLIIANQNHRQLKEPTSLFEHFLVVGLHSCANVEAIEDAFVKRKAWENGAVKSDVLDLRKIQYHGSIPTLEPQVCTITSDLQLFVYLH